MYNKCCVVTCGSRRKDVNLYRFPKTEIGLKKWVLLINCERLRNLSIQALSKQFVCRKHFEKRFFASTQLRSRLVVGAYPTLFTDSEISSGVPQNGPHNDDTKTAVTTEHNYSKKRHHEDHTYSKVEVAEKRRRIESVSGSDVLPSTSRQPEHAVENMPVPSTSNFRMIPTEDAIAKNAVVEPAPKLRTKRKRVVFKKQTMSPCCTELYREYVKSRKQLEFSKRARRAMKFSKEKSFEKLTNKINPLARKILWMQIKQCTKQAKGRRFSNEEKLIALSILKQSPKCYRFLHKIFILPSKGTLNRMIAELNVEAGINTQIFEAVKEEVSTWKENKKYCSLLFDEVSLEAALSYDKYKDCINGFVELTERTNDFADHALVFLLRGAIEKWQQPLVFYFCKGATSGVALKKIITDVIVAVCNTGLLPVALISDQGTAFQSALKGLMEITRRDQILAGDKVDDVIIINGHTLSVIFDPPHLIKGLRNNFLTKNIKYEKKISKWSDIVEVYKTDCNHTHVRLLHKLTDEHVIPEKIKKMKVKNCVKVLSKTMAATLSYTAQFSHYADGKEVSETLKNTAEMVSFFDDLFDSVNGATVFSKKNKGKPLRHAVTEKSPNHEFWREAIKKLEQIKFIDSRGKETSVPSLKNWVITLKSFQRLWQFFKSKGIKIIRPRYFNSDPIENFFGQVRAYNFRNNDPNCQSFKSTFRSLLITRFIQFHSDSYNCEEDSGEQLLKLKALFETNQTASRLHESSCNRDVVGPPESSGFQNAENSHPTPAQERLNIHSRAYTAGWVIRKILKKNKCKECEVNLTSEDIHFPKNHPNNWIACREYKSLKVKKLTYPAESAVRWFGEITMLANNYLECNPQEKNLVKHLEKLLKTKFGDGLCDFLRCEEHKNTIIARFLKLTLRLTVFNWCRCSVINKILKGTDVVRLLNKRLPPMQEKALNKYKTKLKNKSLQK